MDWGGLGERRFDDALEETGDDRSAIGGRDPTDPALCFYGLGLPVTFAVSSVNDWAEPILGAENSRNFHAIDDFAPTHDPRADFSCP